MRPIRKCAIFGVLLAGVSFSALAADMDYFPWTQGTEWVYNTIDKNEKTTFEMKVVMEGPWEEDGISGMIMTQKDKRGKMRQFLLKDKQGIFAKKLGLSKSYTPEINTRFTPTLPMVIFPLTPGTTVHWEGQLKVRGIMNKAIILDGSVVGWEDLSVPAGKFHCIKLHLHQKRDKDIIDEDVWYADGVGQVKYDGGQYIKELKSYNVVRDK